MCLQIQYFCAGAGRRCEKRASWLHNVCSFVFMSHHRGPLNGFPWNLILRGRVISSGINALWGLVKNQRTFRRNIQSRSKKLAWCSACSLFHATFLLGLYFVPEDWGSIISETSGSLRTACRSYNSIQSIFESDTISSVFNSRDTYGKNAKWKLLDRPVPSLFSPLSFHLSWNIWGGGKMLEWGRYWQHGKREGLATLYHRILSARSTVPPLLLSAVKESFSQKLVIMI